MSLVRYGCLCVSFMLPGTALAGTYNFTPISVPGAAITTEAGMNDSDAVIGTWGDSNNNNHGYLYQGGKFTDIDVTGATGTQALGINASGTIVGASTDAKFNDHGFTLSQGKITPLDVPGALFTLLTAINAGGTTAAAAFAHGNLADYVKTRAGFTQIATIQDAPVAINAAGTVIGQTFVYASGKAAPITIPNAGLVAAGGINNSGTIVGYFYDNTDKLVKGFVLKRGRVTVVTRPGWPETFLSGINSSGAICGYSTNANTTKIDGFVLTGGKVFTSIAPGMNAFPLHINLHGSVAGVVGGNAFLATPTGK